MSEKEKPESELHETELHQAELRTNNGPQRISYRRNLPHHVPPGFPLFLTWNLKGSFPKHARAAMEAEQIRLDREPRRKQESAKARNIRHARMLFAKQDRFLDKAASHTSFRHEKRHRNDTVAQQNSSPYDTSDNEFNDRPMWLSDPKAAAVMVGSFLWGVPDRYELYSFVVLGNHVHMLLTPNVDLSTITQGIKGWTARQINRMLGRKGTQFWQNESYDHWARDEDEMFRIIEYIENNPVMAGLCTSPSDWRWSSAFWRKTLGWRFGEPF